MQEQQTRSPHHTTESIAALTDDAMVFPGRTPKSLLNKIMFMIMGSATIAVVIALTNIYLQKGHINPRIWPFISGMLAFLMLYTWVIGKVMARVVAKRKIPLTLRIDSLGISLQDITGIYGPIPWSHLGKVTSRNFLTFPIIHIKLVNSAATKKLLGMKYWLFYFPGGIGLRSDVFDLNAEDLAVRIERYRERGLE
jgi:hypothetical protein